MGLRNGGKTEGITLRLPKTLLQAYAEIANRANLIDLKNGGRGKMTVQDVLRHRLASLPLLMVRAKREGGAK